VPLSGPIVLTHSIHDRALCAWHRVIEREPGIGCRGVRAGEPHRYVTLKPIELPYSGDDFANDVANVDASGCFQRGGLAEGTHSDFWKNETLHLIASMPEQVRCIRIVPVNTLLNRRK
jgi:hypothetical protein